MRRKYTDGLSALCDDRIELLELLLTASTLNADEVRNLAELLAAYQGEDPEAIKIVNMESTEATQAMRAYIGSRRSASVC